MNPYVHSTLSFLMTLFWKVHYLKKAEFTTLQFTYISLREKENCCYEDSWKIDIEIDLLDFIFQNRCQWIHQNGSTIQISLIEMGFVLCFDFEKFWSVEQKRSEGECQNVILEIFFRQIVRSA